MQEAIGSGKTQTDLAKPTKLATWRPSETGQRTSQTPPPAERQELHGPHEPGASFGHDWAGNIFLAKSFARAESQLGPATGRKM